MSTHTKTPWYCEGDAIFDNEECVGTPIAHVLSSEYSEDGDAIDARRIVVCLNLLHRISTETLEAFARTGIRLADATEGYVSELEQQRDQLLAALERIADPSALISNGDPSTLREFARTAIAAAQGGEA